MYTHETFVNVLHVSIRHRCDHQGVLLVANVALLLLLRGLPDDRTYNMPKHVQDLLTSDMCIFWYT